MGAHPGMSLLHGFQSRTAALSQGTVEEHQATNGAATAAGDIAVENPATGEVIAHVPDMSAEQVAEQLKALGLLK